MENTIGLFYGSSTGNCDLAARKIQQIVGLQKVNLHDIFYTPACTLDQYQKMIFGVSTWGIGNVQDDWAEFIPAIEKHDFTGKTVALYGYGDQLTYPGSFVDAIGHLHEILVRKNAQVTGYWPVNGYHFTQSKARQNGHFLGLALDDDNQPQLTDKRINDWIVSLNGFFA